VSGSLETHEQQDETSQEHSTGPRRLHRVPLLDLLPGYYKTGLAQLRASPVAIRSAAGRLSEMGEGAPLERKAAPPPRIYLFFPSPPPPHWQLLLRVSLSWILHT